MGTPTWGGSPPLCYFAEPIDQAAGRDFRIAAEMAGMLKMWGCGVFRPAAGFIVRQPDPRVEQINRYALYRADVIVAYLDEKTPSIGVPAEIEAATARGIPAVVHYTGQSFVLAGNPLVTVIDTPISLISALEQALKDHPRTGQTEANLGVTITGNLERLAAAETVPGLKHRFKLRDEPPLDIAQVVRQAYEKLMANRRYGPIGEPIRLVLANNTTPPSRAYHDDAGIDLTTARKTTIEPGDYKDIHTQVEATQLPPGYWGLITGRSSALRRWRLHIPMAIIDPGWRGPLFVGVWNLGGNPVTVEPGDRLGQLILIPNNPAPVEIVTAVDDHPRGLKGFGSSG